MRGLGDGADKQKVEEMARVDGCWSEVGSW